MHTLMGLVFASERHRAMPLRCVGNSYGFAPTAWRRKKGDGMRSIRAGTLLMLSVFSSGLLECNTCGKEDYHPLVERKILLRKRFYGRSPDAMKWIILIFSLVVCPSLSGQDSRPDWSTRTFSASADRIFDAALASIASQHYEVQQKSPAEKAVRFRVGRSAFSWGYVMVLKVFPAENNTSSVAIDVDRLRGPGSNGRASLVAGGKKEVTKLFDGIEKELSNGATIGK